MADRPRGGRSVIPFDLTRARLPVDIGGLDRATLRGSQGDELRPFPEGMRPVYAFLAELGTAVQKQIDKRGSGARISPTALEDFFRPFDSRIIGILRRLDTFDASILEDKWMSAKTWTQLARELKNFEASLRRPVDHDEEDEGPAAS